MEHEVYWNGASLFIAGILLGGVSVAVATLLAIALTPVVETQVEDELFEDELVGFIDGESEQGDPDTITLELVGGPGDGKTLNVNKDVGLLTYPHPNNSGEWEAHEYRRCWDRATKCEVMVYAPLVRD
jgi:hypothetical protein